MKKFYILYELEAENKKQAQSITVDLYNRNRITPIGIFEKTEFNLFEFIKNIKEK